MTFNLSRRAFGLATLGLAVASVPRLGFAQSAAYANPNLLIEPNELINAASAMIGNTDAVLIDVRPREEFDAGHIPSARHLDPNAVAADKSPIDGTLRGVADLEKLLGNVGIAADRRIIFYDDRGGFHAARMLWLMEYLGHRNVALLNGGWTSWLEAGGAVETQVSAFDLSVFQAALSPRRHATAQDVLSHRGNSDAVLIDVRPTKMFDEGHIPWAANIPWADNLDQDSRFKQVSDLMAHFERHGVTPEHDVIMHCQVGLASSHSYVALRLLGFPRIRVYHRSWAEWGSDAALPKVTA